MKLKLRINFANAHKLLLVASEIAHALSSHQNYLKKTKKGMEGISDIPSIPLFISKPLKYALPS